MTDDDQTFTVRAKRWKRGWELTIDGVGVTQAKRLTEAEKMAKSYISMVRDLEEDAIAVSIIPVIDDELDQLILDLRAQQERAAREQEAASRSARELVSLLRKEEDLSQAEIAVVLDISPQRVNQLLGSPTSRLRLRNP